MTDQSFPWFARPSIQWLGWSRIGVVSRGWARWWVTARGPNYRVIYWGPVRMMIPLPWSKGAIYGHGYNDGFMAGIEAARLMPRESAA